MTPPKIILVEDDHEKAMAIKDALASASGPSVDQVQVYTDIKSARAELQEQIFDILILDLNLPPDAGRPPSPGTGLSLLKQVYESNRYKRPRHVIFISEFSEEIENAKKENVGRSWHSILYNRASSSWSADLVQKVEYVLSSEEQRVHRDPNKTPSTKVIVTLLLLYQVLYFAAIYVGWRFVINQTNLKPLGVPVAIWQWSLLGAITGVLYSLGFRRSGDPEGRLSLFVWALAKPFVGTALGAIVYFMAICGMLALNGKSEIENTGILCVISFLAAFSDRFSIQLINKVMGSAASPELTTASESPDKK